MCRKLVSCVAFVLLLALVGTTSAEVVDGEREWNDRTQICNMGGLEVTATGHAIFNARVDHDGCDVTIEAGGILETNDTYKLPAGHPEPTPTNVFVNGTWNAHDIESKGTSRAATIYVGATGVINLQMGYGGTGPNADYDPQTWLNDNSLLVDPSLDPAVWDVDLWS